MQILLKGNRIDPDVLRHEVQPLMLSPDDERAEQLAGRLLRAAENPETWQGLMNELADEEPGVAVAVTLDDEAEDGDFQLVTSRNISESVVTTAGRALTSALGNHFIFTAESIIVNPDNPPTIEDSTNAVIATLSLKESAGKLDNYSTWMLGNLVDVLEQYHGEEFDISQVMENTGRAYNTLVTAVGVYRAFRNRRYNLPFTAHKEVFYCRIDDEDKHFVLGIAEKLQLGTKTIRSLASRVRNYGRDSITPEMTADKQTLEESLTVRRVTHDTFAFKANNRWYKYRGPSDNIPDNAENVINLDKRQFLSHVGQFIELLDWHDVM